MILKRVGPVSVVAISQQLIIDPKFFLEKKSQTIDLQFPRNWNHRYNFVHIQNVHAIYREKNWDRNSNYLDPRIISDRSIGKQRVS